MLHDYLDAPALRWGPLLLTGLFLAAFVGFILRSALHGRPHTARVEKAGGSVLLSKYMMEYGLWVFGPLTRTAIQLGVHPAILIVAGGVVGVAFFR